MKQSFFIYFALQMGSLLYRKHLIMNHIIKLFTVASNKFSPSMSFFDTMESALM
jgi:hypothetical protein